MRTRRRALQSGSICFVLASLANAVLGDIWSVPSEYVTIQAAIDVATNGDIVEIADGTYTGMGNKDLDLGGKAITVRSTSGNPALCVIDCEKDGRGFYFHSGEQPDSVIDGVTIANGFVDGGGPGYYFGGGVYCIGSSPTLTNCIIRDNVSFGWKGAGGGVYCESSSPLLTKCTITGNSAPSPFGLGGGLFASGSSSPTLSQCKIVNNAAWEGGGGVSCYNSSSPILINTTFRQNRAANGGGVHCDYYASPTIIACTISRNAADSGAGIYCIRSSPDLSNCVISKNQATNNGGAILCSNEGNVLLTNCTITGNSASTGGGLVCANGNPILANCILWGDAPQEIYVYGGSPAVTYSDVQGGWTGVGNINADPLFGFSDDLHLQDGSPCIDSATSAPVGGLPAVDIEENARPLDGDGDTMAVPDMGAFEFNPAVPAIALSATNLKFLAAVGGSNPGDQSVKLRNCGGGTLDWTITGRLAWLTVAPESGSSSGDLNEVTLGVNSDELPHGSYISTLLVSDSLAVNSPRAITVSLDVSSTLHVPSEYPTIQDAINAAVTGDVVELADGTYSGDGNKDLDFGGKAITVRSASGVPAQCVIDCEHVGRGFHFHNYEGQDSVVQGLAITNGYVDGDEGGGAVYCDYGSPTIRNCRIADNAAPSGGGVEGVSSNVHLIDCTIVMNAAVGSYGSGGGVVCSARSSLVRCTIADNTAVYSGGGVELYSGSVTLDECAIIRNSASRTGGIYCSGDTHQFTNCEIAGNAAESFAGGIYCGWGTPIFNNCLIRGNHADNQGGGVCSSGSYTEPKFNNCVFVSNTAGLQGGAVYVNASTDVSITNCIMRDNYPQGIDINSGVAHVSYSNVQGGWTGDGNIDADPVWLDPDGPDDDPVTWEDNDYRLGTASPCIDAGSNSYAATDADLDGHARIVDGNFDGAAAIDMGAYEYVPADLDGDGDVNRVDYGLWADCLAGPAVVHLTGCGLADLDGDNDIDLRDFARVQMAFD